MYFLGKTITPKVPKSTNLDGSIVCEVYAFPAYRSLSCWAFISPSSVR